MVVGDLALTTFLVTLIFGRSGYLLDHLLLLLGWLTAIGRILREMHLKEAGWFVRIRKFDVLLPQYEGCTIALHRDSYLASLCHLDLVKVAAICP